MNAHFNSTVRPANAKPWVGAMIYATELEDKEALQPDAYVVSEVSDSAFKVDGWPHWLPFSRVDYLLPDFITCSGDPKDTAILALHARFAPHWARAAELEPVAHGLHPTWKAACIAAEVWDGPGGRVIPKDQKRAAVAECDRIAIETGYKAARDAWQQETMMIHLLQEAINTIPANTARGLAIQSEIAVQILLDETNIDTLDHTDGGQFDWPQRHLIRLAQTARRVAEQQSGIVLADLDLTAYDIDRLAALAQHIKEFANQCSDFNELPAFTVKLGDAISWDHNANGRIAERIAAWSEAQHSRVMATIEAMVPASRNEAYERCLARLEWAWRCGDDLSTIAGIVAEGREQQQAFVSPAPKAELVMAEFANLDEAGQEALLATARGMVAQKQAA